MSTPTERCSDCGSVHCTSPLYRCWPPLHPQPQSSSDSVWVIVNTSNHFHQKTNKRKPPVRKKVSLLWVLTTSHLVFVHWVCLKVPSDGLIYNFSWADKSSPSRFLLLLLLCYPSMDFSWSIKQKHSDPAKVWPTLGTNNLPVTHWPHLAVGNNNVGSQVITAGKLEEEIYEFQSKCLACYITEKLRS